MSKKKESTIKELLKTSRGRAILFFGCYFFFFLFLILFFRTGIYKKSYRSYDSFEPGTSDISYQFDFIKGNNYEYQYKIVIDDVVYSYNGMKDSKREIFTFNGNDYYREFDDFYMKKDEGYIKVSNPFVLEDFYQSSSIESLVSQSMLFSNTNFKDGGGNINFQITTDTILLEIDQLKTDLDSLVNEITLSLDNNQNVVGIKYQLPGYAQYLGKKSIQIECNYSSFSDVSIESPL